MCSLVLLLLIQAAPVSQKNFLPNPEHKESIPEFVQPSPPRILTPSPQQTAPSLSPYSEPTPYEIGREMGGQNEALGELRSRVGTLEKDRRTVDRPDINSLKTSRSYFVWSGSILSTILATVAGLLWYFRKIIWKDSIRPRLAKEIDKELRAKEKLTTSAPSATHY